MNVLSNEPLVCYYFKVFTPEECDDIINNCGEFYASRHYNAKDGVAEVSKIRTSTTFFDAEYKFRKYQEKIYDTVKDKLNCDISQFEPLFVLKYTVGQQYYEHRDFYNEPGAILTQNDRFATTILYLNEGFEGGETFFKHLKITVKPEKGSLLLFDYKYNHQTNLLTRHQGLPVYYGTKYIATQWVRYKPYKHIPGHPTGN